MGRFSRPCNRHVGFYTASVDMSGLNEDRTDNHEQTLLLVLKLSDAQMGSVTERAQIMAFAQGLDLDLQATGIGELEGHEMGDGRCVLTFCGPDVDLLMDQLRPLLRRSPLCEGGHLVRMVKNDADRWEQRALPI